MIAKDVAGNTAQDSSDADFAMFSSVAPGSKEVTYKYDKLNRLVEVKYEDGTTITYTYDSAGNILSRKVVSKTRQRRRP